MKLYEIDYKRLALLLLPPFLRQYRLFAFLSAMVFGVSQVYEAFIRNREQNLIRLKRNGQVCYLRAALNEELDPIEKRIALREEEYEGDQWLIAGSEEEACQLFILPEWVDEEGGRQAVAENVVCSENLLVGNSAFFYVLVPFSASAVDKVNRLKSFLNEQKLLSKRYSIKYEQAKF